MDHRPVLIQVEDVTFSYPRQREPVLHGVSFSLTGGEVHGLAGHNGAGKTTLLLVCAGVLYPRQGRVLVLGRTTVRGTSANEVALITEALKLPGMFTVAETLELFAAARGVPACAFDEMAERLELTQWRDRRIGQLSTGLRARVKLAAALAGDPKILLLDEPFSGLDPVSSDVMVAELARRQVEGAGVVVASHDLPMLERVADRVTLMKSGQVLRSGTLAELIPESQPTKQPGATGALSELYLSLHAVDGDAVGGRPGADQDAGPMGSS